MTKSSVRFIGEASIRYYVGANEFFTNSQSSHFTFTHSIGGDVHHALSWATALGKEVSITTLREEGIRGDEVMMQLQEYAGDHNAIKAQGYRHHDTITVEKLTDASFTVFSKPSVIFDTFEFVLQPHEYCITAGFFTHSNEHVFSGTVILRDPLSSVDEVLHHADMLVCTPSVVRHFTSLSGIWNACHEWYEKIARDFFVVTERAEVYAMIGGELSLYEPPSDVRVFDTALAFGVVVGLHHDALRDDQWIYAMLEKVCSLPEEGKSHEKKPFLSD